MPLAEDKRQQLDSIVSQMVQNKESDEDIQFVVNDFKSKYEGARPKGEKSLGEALQTGFGLTKAVELGKAALSPIKSLKGLGEMGKQIGGGFEPQYNEQGELMGFKKVPIAPAPPMIEKWKDPKKTLIEDPTGGYGMLADVSGLASGVGGVLGKASQAGRVATGVGKYTNPIGWPGEVTGGVRTLIGKTEWPESLYARSMKMPPGSLREEKRASVLKTMVRDEALPLGKATRQEMNSIVAEIEGGISKTLDNLSTSGAKLKIDVVSKALDDLKDNYSNRPNPERYYNVIDKVKKDFIDHDFVQRGKFGWDWRQGPNQPATKVRLTPDTMTLSDAQALKKGTYSELEQYYAKGEKPETGRVGIKNDIEAAAKAKSASTIREAILSHPDVPGSVRMDLSREAGLMNARKWVERAANRGQNLDPVSLGGMAFGILVEGGVPGAVAYKIATSQTVQSRFAIFLAHGSKIARKVGTYGGPASQISIQSQRTRMEE